jgi:dTDP-4-amino-4,6-dideoxy-D-galactose acyltransferase
LFSIVLESGEYSRFKIDKKISSDKFEKLYERWMLNGIEKIEGSVIYVSTNILNEIEGFIQIKILKEEKIIIELIAVSRQARGKGIGSKLLKDIENIANNNGISIIEVVTQDENVPATTFYLSNSFNLQKREYIYHLWKQ